MSSLASVLSVTCCGAGPEPEGNVVDEKSMGLTSTTSRHSTQKEQETGSELDDDDFDGWKHLGLLKSIYTIVKRSPELRSTYSLLLIACFGAGESDVEKMMS